MLDVGWVSWDGGTITNCETTSCDCVSGSAAGARPAPINEHDATN